MLYLEVVTRAGTRQVALVGSRMTIGRLSYNDIVIADNQISRQHAELRYVDGIWWIADLKSTNGIHVNERRVPVHRLANGDSLTLAPEVRLRVYDDQQAPQRAQLGSLGQQGQQGQQGARGDASASSAGWSASGVARAAPLALAQSQPANLATPPASANGAAPSPTPQPSPPTVRASTPIATRSNGPNRANGSNGPNRANGSNGAHGAHGFDATRSAPGDAAAQRVTSGPVPSGPWSAGGETDDPFRRSLADAAVRPNLLPAQKLLHVCQTCGQLTAPDAIYCQSCHHSVAYACAHCGFSLLPIQDRCPRCQAPNPGSVRRAHHLPS